MLRKNEEAKLLKLRQMKIKVAKPVPGYKGWHHHVENKEVTSEDDGYRYQQSHQNHKEEVGSREPAV